MPMSPYAACGTTSWTSTASRSPNGRHRQKCALASRAKVVNTTRCFSTRCSACVPLDRGPTAFGFGNRSGSAASQSYSPTTSDFPAQSRNGMLQSCGCQRVARRSKLCRLFLNRSQGTPTVSTKCSRLDGGYGAAMESKVRLQCSADLPMRLGFTINLRRTVGRSSRPKQAAAVHRGGSHSVTIGASLMHRSHLYLAARAHSGQ